MFIRYDHSAFRLTGRFFALDDAATATAPGSRFELAFRGRAVALHFAITDLQFTYPHVYFILDNGPKIEAALDRILRIEALTDGEHILQVILKSSCECQNRWEMPLQAKMALLGADVENPGILPPDTRKTLELVGDSITEGVLIDDFNCPLPQGDSNRPFQDDVTATYGWLTAQALNLRSLHFSYGAVGVTRGGNGGVPACPLAYPYCFANCPADNPLGYGHPDYILVNHGANDRRGEFAPFWAGYRELLRMLRQTHPQAKIIVLSAFCGCFHLELGEAVAQFNRETGDSLFYIDSCGWIPEEPLHPRRDGHRIVAEHLIPILREKFAL